MDITEWSKFAGWGVGIIATIAAVITQLRAERRDSSKDYRAEVQELLDIKDEIIKEREGQAEELRLENSLLKGTIAELEKKLDGMEKRIDTIEQQRGNDLEQMLKAASRTTLCLNAPTCLNRIIPTPDN